MKELIASGKISDFCETIDQKPYCGKELIFDFRGVQEIKGGDAEKLMSMCYRMKEQGLLIRFKDLSLMVRNQFLLYAIDGSKDEISI